MFINCENRVSTNKFQKYVNTVTHQIGMTAAFQEDPYGRDKDGATKNEGERAKRRDLTGVNEHDLKGL